MMSAYSNEQLVLEALDDSHTAFEQLIEQYQYRVLRTIASIISDDLAAHDVAQETFLSAWSNLPKLKEKQKFGSWLNQIAVNLSKHWLRDRRKYQEHTASLKDMISSTQERSYKSDKLRQEIWEAVDGLTDDYREAVILYYITGYSYKEISTMLLVPVSTVHGRLQEARNQLRKEFLDMVTQLQLEIDSTVHKFLKERAKQDGVPIEGLILRLIERYKRDTDRPEIAVRKAWDRLTSFDGDPSPDGRYLSIVNWETFNLAVYDLITGETRDITSDGRSNGCARGSTWSPDGKQIACAWHDRLGRWELRIVGFDGSEPRVLWHEEDEKPSRIRPCDWSQDGKFVAGMMGNRPDGTSEIVLVSVADGSVRSLKSLQGNWLRPTKTTMSLSQDGRYVVYQRPVKENDELRGLFLLATDGSGEEIPLVGHLDGDDYKPAWAPDGKTIVFVSNSGPVGTTSLWLTQVIDGKQVGEPQFVMRSAGNVWPLGFTLKRSLYYGVYCGNPNSDIYVTSLDMETGEVISQPTRLPLEGSNCTPSWSPDGERLAYVSRRPSPEGAGYAFRHVLVIRSMESGEERVILPEKSLYNHWMPLGWLRWSPDGRSILCGGYDDLGIHLIDIQTGDITTVVKKHPRIKLWGLAWSPDGKTIFYIRHRKEKGEQPYSIMVHDLATGEERELYPSGNKADYGLVISPDGRELAFLDYRKTGYVLTVIPTADGEARELPKARAPIAWTPDGRHLLCIRTKRLPDSDKVVKMEVWRIPAEGGEPEKVWEPKGPPPAGVPSFHPDGQRIAYCKGDHFSAQKELWVMDNLLTTFAADK